jgi:hypothetical protein
VDFQIRQEIGAPLAAVEARLTDAAFIAATGALAPLADCRLLDVSTSAGRTRARIHRRFAADLPSVVTAVVDPRRLTWVEEALFDHSDHTASHRIVPEHYGDLLQCSYRTTLRSDGDHTVRDARGTLRVRVLIGGKQVERAIVSGLTDYAAAEATLLATWTDPATPS